MAKQMPKVFYGLHFVTGPAEYSGPEDRIYIGEEAAKQMDATFAGKPVYVQHKEVNLDKIQEEADGYVVESFFNPCDGKHWAKFVVVSDAGHEAIMNGWKLSNAYAIVKSGEGGLCHNIEYAREVLSGEYNHLAIVQNPRYEESVILTPEEFKSYNNKKQNELKVLQNSKEKPKGKFMFKFFKKEEIENSKDLAATTVILKNGQEVTVEKLVDLANAKNEADEKAAKEAKEKEEEDKKNALEKEAKEKEEKENAAKKNSEDMDADDEKKKKEEEEKKNAAEKEAKEREEKMNEIRNAADSFNKPVVTIDTQMNQIARGKRLYGSTL